MADLSAERLCSLPGNWSYGISQGGRLFFINEEAKSTTWLHPHTGEAVITGHRRSADLPTGWEEAYTFEGARYYINQDLFLSLTEVVSQGGILDHEGKGP
ncbi:pleckstrin homology domain-containing family A member 5 isoform X20 [Gopherus flavomarginatus]|uniref:pleckstrin homology domain-containing family A member 5 isoform X20 n=1 Tax=Gopherus flavomarginatus TaxID=286002 RepID=UPI0021CBEA16|nr:pleckstrin homology domain-containing family A member 5 isoform X20 [Gopherus flavomarginatus]